MSFFDGFLNKFKEKLGENLNDRKILLINENTWISGFERKVFCLIMDLPESNSSKKIESKVQCNLPEDYYAF